MTEKKRLKEFYIFSPITIETQLFYKSREELNSKLLQYFALKTYPQFAVRIRCNPIFVSLSENLFKRELSVPKENIFLVYMGRDATTYFCKDSKEKIFVLREEKGLLKRESFKGFPIHYNFSLPYISNKKLIIDVLKKHLGDLKTGKTKTHGDFTVFNILVDGKKISIIDQKENRSASILTDFFYFYTYFLRRIKRHNPLNKETRKILKAELDEIYEEVFGQEDSSLLSELGKITPKDFLFSKKKTVFDSSMERYSQLMIRLLKK